MHLVFEIQGLWAYDAKREKLAGTLVEGAAVWLSHEPHPKDQQAIAIRLRGNSNAMLGYLPRTHIPEIGPRLLSGEAYEAKVANLSTRKHQGANQLSCQIALTFSIFSSPPINKKSEGASLHTTSDVVSKRCAECDCSLLKKPLILVEKTTCCYRCAKQLVPKLEQERKNRALDEYNKLMEPYTRSKTDFEAALQTWEKRRLETIKSTFWSDKVCGVIALLGAILGTAGGIQGFVWGGIGGFVVALIFHAQDEKRLFENYLKNHPRPTFGLEPPTYPSIEPVNYFCLAPSSDDPLMSREAILERDQYTCQSCGQQKKVEKLEVHHVLPRAKDGSDTATNLVTLCLHCHDREDWFGHIRAYPTTFPKRRPLPARFRRFR